VPRIAMVAIVDGARLTIRFENACKIRAGEVRVGAAQISSGTPFCRIYAAAKNSVVRPVRV